VRARTQRLGLIALAGVLLVSALTLAFCSRRDRVEGHAYDIPSGSDRILVEVLNATPRPGLARDVTRELRRAGLDVVGFGNASGDDRRDSTTVLVRRGDAAAGDRVADVLGQGLVAVETDTLLRVDVTVILGEDFHAAHPLHP
jgi:calcineurin-like phosphoesterase